MVFIKSTHFLLIASFLLCQIVDVVTGRAVQGEVEARVQELEKSSNDSYVYYDVVTGSFVSGHPPWLSTRSEPDDPVLALLRQHQGQDFCKLYCVNDYNPQPVTVYTTLIETETLKKTRTISLPLQTTTDSVLGSFSPASTIIDILTSQESTVVTIEAPTETISFEDTSTISTSVTSIVDAPTETVTDIFSTTVTDVIHLPGPTTTVTSALTSSQAPARARRGISVPSWLEGYGRPAIMHACHKLISPPCRKTVTSTVETCTTTTAYATISIGGNEVTTTTAVPQPASTITELSLTTLVSTIETTETPLVSETDTILVTDVVTALQTVTPLTTKTTTSLTTMTTTTIDPVTTLTTCGETFYDVIGISYLDGAENAVSASVGSLFDCCSLCFNTPGCTAWLFSPSVSLNGCLTTLKSQDPGETSPASCPLGTGDIEIFTRPMAFGGMSGPGPCIDTFSVTAL